MGIDNIFDLLKSINPDIYNIRKITDFRRGKVAIDFDNVMFTYLMVCNKKVVDNTDVINQGVDQGKVMSELYSEILRFTFRWLDNGIVPVYVCDGAYLPEKAGTQAKRREERRKNFEKAREKKEYIDKLDISQQTPQMVTEYRKLLHRSASISGEEKDSLKFLLTGIGIPVLTASYDGEHLAAVLCKEGLVQAVFSTDSDVLAFGSPILIKEFMGNEIIEVDGFTKYTPLMKTVSLSDTLFTLGVSMESFRDLCIMLGCDFNSHNHIKNVGQKKAYNLIKRFGTIDKIPRKSNNTDDPDNILLDANLCSLPVVGKTGKVKGIEYIYDISVLDHITCRRIFREISSKEIFDSQFGVNGPRKEICLEINTEVVSGDLRTILDQYGCIDFISLIHNSYRELINKTGSWALPPTEKMRSEKVKESEEPEIILE